MDQTPLIKDDRVLSLNLNGHAVWIVRFKNNLFLKKAFDNDAELLEALGADDRAATVQVQTSPEIPWSVIEFILNGEPIYTVYDGAHGDIVEEATHHQTTARTSADQLNQQFNEKSRPPRP